MAHVVLVPGAAVRRYAAPAARALASRGLGVRLMEGPGQPGVPTDLAAYGSRLRSRLARTGGADLVVGLSFGSQVVAAAAAGSPTAHLVLVSPTVDPECRSLSRLIGRWAADGHKEPMRLLADQLPDWRRAGTRRILATVRSALELPLEDVLDSVPGRVTVVHATRDEVTSHAYAASLSGAPGRALVLVPGATHSWPYGDEDRFADLVQELLA